MIFSTFLLLFRAKVHKFIYVSIETIGCVLKKKWAIGKMQIYCELKLTYLQTNSHDVHEYWYYQGYHTENCIDFRYEKP